MSETTEMLKDLLHLAGMAFGSGRHMPSEMILDRYSYERLLEKRKRYQSNKLIKELKKQELVAISEKGDKIIFSISDKAKFKLLKDDVKFGSEFLPKGKVCLVSFDIPEHVRASRNVLRHFLKEADFELVHQSVWRSPYDVVEPLRELIDKLGIEDWVKVYLAEEKHGR